MVRKKGEHIFSKTNLPSYLALRIKRGKEIKILILNL